MIVSKRGGAWCYMTVPATDVDMLINQAAVTSQIVQLEEVSNDG